MKMVNRNSNRLRRDYGAQRGELDRILDILRRVKVLTIFIGLMTIFIILSVSTRNFFNVPNLIRVLRQSSFVGIMALGAVFVLSEGDVDLSVGGIYNVVGIITAFSLEHGLTVGAAIPIGLLTGVVCGLTNVSLSLLFGIPTLIITLGTMNIYRGFGFIISQGRSLLFFPKDNIFFQFFGGTIGQMPFSVIAFITLTFSLAYLYRYTKFGIHTRAIGGSRLIARAMGIKISRSRVFVLMLNGLLSAIAALLNLAYIRSADPNLGRGFEFMVIASAIIGGTALIGGSGTVVGGMIGAILIAVIRNGIVLLGIKTYWNSVVTGAVIIVAIAIDYMFKRKQFTYEKS